MRKKVGAWLIGALGQVGTCTMVGHEAVKRNIYPPIGLVSELADFRQMALLPLDQLLFGGYELRPVTLKESAREVYEKAGTISLELLQGLDSWMEAQQENFKPGYLTRKEGAIERFRSEKSNLVLSPIEIVERVQRDLQEFQQKHDLETVIMVNVASTERPFQLAPEIQTPPQFEQYLKSNGEVPVSSIYAYGALKGGFPYINFTPSTGVNLLPLLALAKEKNIPIMGQDGKTGETLLKTTLAPMFVARHLKVLSWEGYNILGNRDGMVLEDPSNSQSKLRSKDESLRDILQDSSFHSKVTIDYVPSLDDWKTAWDFIHFKGFLNTKMIMQFIWQGCDSALAAPLVLDLIRFAHFAHQRQEGFLMKHLACFFKNPLGVQEHRFMKQFDLLTDYVKQHTSPSL
ncbi:MAG: inositol-3-phosphate synthase [Planctomycetota bacterium]